MTAIRHSRETDNTFAPSFSMETTEKRRLSGRSARTKSDYRFAGGTSLRTLKEGLADSWRPDVVQVRVANDTLLADTMNKVASLQIGLAA